MLDGKYFCGAGIVYASYIHRVSFFFFFFFDEESDWVVQIDLKPGKAPSSATSN